jgi:hypothetical protein
MSFLNKIGDFIQGNYRLILDERFDSLAPHIKEQVLYRAEICKDSCLPAGECEYCGCETPGKLYVTKSCNKGEKFPNLMEEEDWKKYKIENNVKISIQLP